MKIDMTTIDDLEKQKKINSLISEKLNSIKCNLLHDGNNTFIQDFQINGENFVEEGYEQTLKKYIDRLYKRARRNNSKNAIENDEYVCSNYLNYLIFSQWYSLVFSFATQYLEFLNAYDREVIDFAKSNGRYSTNVDGIWDKIKCIFSEKYGSEISVSDWKNLIPSTETVDICKELTGVSLGDKKIMKNKLVLLMCGAWPFYFPEKKGPKEFNQYMQRINPLKTIKGLEDIASNRDLRIKLENFVDIKFSDLETVMKNDNISYGVLEQCIYGLQEYYSIKNIINGSDSASKLEKAYNLLACYCSIEKWGDVCALPVVDAVFWSIIDNAPEIIMSDFRGDTDKKKGDSKEKKKNRLRANTIIYKYLDFFIELADKTSWCHSALLAYRTIEIVKHCENISEQIITEERKKDAGLVKPRIKRELDLLEQMLKCLKNSNLLENIEELRGEPILQEGFGDGKCDVSHMAGVLAWYGDLISRERFKNKKESVGKQQKVIKVTIEIKNGVSKEENLYRRILKYGFYKVYRKK